MDEIDKYKLVEAAFKAREYSYAPYSEFLVGAALLTSDGKVYSGCNVENASYGLTICAERCAALKAVSGGNRIFTAIAIAGMPKGKTVDTADKEAAPSFAYPCGACRQFLREFAAKDMKVYAAASLNLIREFTLEELLPSSFGPENLE